MSSPPALAVDVADFDAIGIVTDLVVTLRVRAIERDVDAAATIHPPEGWHPLVITARPSGHLVLGVRYLDLSTSRWKNVSKAIAQRGWDLDEDEDGATRRYPPGTEATTAAFEALAVLTISGAPAGTRTVTAVDGAGDPIDLAAGPDGAA